MNNNNLINLKDRPQEERVEIAKKGGQKSAENRRNKKLLKEALLEVMNLPLKAKDLDALDDIGDLNKKNVTVIEKIALNLCKRAMDGDEKALNLILELTGERGNQKKQEDIF